MLSDNRLDLWVTHASWRTRGLQRNPNPDPDSVYLGFYVFWKSVLLYI